MKKIACLSLAVIGASLAPSLAHAACTTLGSLPAVISSPGNYCLASDYSTSDPAEHSIELNAHDVTLDCQGHTLSSSASANTGNSAAIYALNRHDITIKNCRIMGGYTTGIQIQQNNSVPNANYYVTIADNYIAGPYLYGILAYGSAIEITGNRIYDVGGQLNTFAAGIRVGAGTGFALHVLKENLIAGTNSPYNNAFGILSDKSVAGVFLRNDVTAGGANASYRNYGIRILAGGTNRITDNHVVGSAQTNNTGIMSNDATTACFDNFIRAQSTIAKCDAKLGNY